MLHDFMIYLGERNPDFKKVKKEDICTSDGTTGAIYYILRKKLRDRKKRVQKSPPKEDTVSEEGHEDHNTDWMQRPPPIPETQTMPPATPKQETPDTKASPPIPEQEDEMEEPSEESDGGEDPEERESASSDSSVIGLDKFQNIKQQFVGHMDVLDEKTAEWVYFEANLKEGSIKVTTFAKAQPKSNWSWFLRHWGAYFRC